MGFRPVEEYDYRNVDVPHSLLAWVVAPGFWYLYISNSTGNTTLGWTAVAVCVIVNFFADWLPASIMGLMVFYWIFGSAFGKFFFG